MFNMGVAKIILVVYNQCQLIKQAICASTLSSLSYCRESGNTYCNDSLKCIFADGEPSAY
jgi:hypothetical protein